MSYEHDERQMAEAGVMVMPALNLLATTARSAAPGKALEPIPTDTPMLKPAGEGGVTSSVMANWGTDNLLPHQILADVEKNAVLAALVDWKSRALSGGGLVYGNLVTDPATGEQRLIPVRDPLVEAWLARTNVKRYLRDATREFYVFWNVFPEFGLTKDRSQIAGIKCHTSPYCRFGVQNKDGLIDTVYINANFADGATPTSPETIPLPVIDPYFDAVQALRDGKGYSYIYPIQGPGSGRTYYKVAPWHAVRLNGWLELANQIPVFKRALLKNQATIKYHVQIPDWWWTWKYPDWDKMPKLKAERMKAELTAFNTQMKGEEKAGNSVLTPVKTDPGSGKPYEGWKISVIDDKLMDGKYIEDSQEACSHLFFAHAIDPTLIGQAPGKKMGAGSGSDKRVAYNIFITQSKSEQDIILEPLEVAFAYNNFLGADGLPYVIQFKNYWMETLDNGKTAQQQSS